MHQEEEEKGWFDATSRLDRWAEERSRQIKETKKISAWRGGRISKEKERWRCRREGVGAAGAQRPPLVQRWAHVSCKNPNWQIVLPWEQRWGYCGESRSKEVKESEGDKGKASLAQATICYSSLPWHQEQPSPGKECTSPSMRKAAKRGRTASHRPDGQHLSIQSHCCRSLFTAYDHHCITHLF